MNSNLHPDLPEDPQTQRTRWELWAIFIIVAVVIVGSLVWRAVGHHRAGPSLDQTYNAAEPSLPIAPLPSAAAPARPGP